jgi:serine/threonine-protein kinase RsbW
MRTRGFHAGEPTVDVRFCLVFPRESLSIPVMRRVLGDTLSRLGVDAACIADLQLAVTEACTNVLRHAGPGHRYEVVARVSRTRCLLEVLDSGRGIDPGALPDRRHQVRGGRADTRLRRRPPPAQQPFAPAVLLGRFSRARRSEDEQAIASLPESGRGLAIMRACVDDVTLRSGPGLGTVVSLRKRLEWRDDAPLTHLPASQLRDAV